MKYRSKYKLPERVSPISYLVLLSIALTLVMPLPSRSTPKDTLLPEPKMMKLSDSLAVKLEDEEGYYTWQLAQKQCATYGKGWHVPEILELLLLYEKKDVIGGFTGEWYWSSSEFYNDFGRSHNFQTGERNDPYEDKNRGYCVRCVKTIAK